MFYALFFFAALFGNLAEGAPDKTENTTLVFNMANEEVLPIHFRSTWDSLHFDDITEPSKQGLTELHISGSGQFSVKGLQAILKRLNHPDPITIIDLRQESHGFINGEAVSWYAPKDWGNHGKTLTQIDQEEHKLLQALSRDKQVDVFNVTKLDAEGYISQKIAIRVTVNTISTEKEVANSARVGYYRIPVTDHMRPTDHDVDRFIEFIRKMPKGTWVHFHCARGDGRTTTFMAMYDMIRNADKVSLEDILQRQWLLGGIRLTQMPNIDSWKYDLGAERLLFLKSFYEYCKKEGPGFKVAWSDFAKKAGKS